VFINWAFPDDSTYDIESILLLKPKHILTVCDTTGAAGGTKFLAWLRMNGVLTDARWEPSARDSVPLKEYGKYNVIASTASLHSTLAGTQVPTIIWLANDPEFRIDNPFPALVSSNFDKCPDKPYSSAASAGHTFGRGSGAFTSLTSRKLKTSGKLIRGSARSCEHSKAVCLMPKEYAAVKLNAAAFVEPLAEPLAPGIGWLEVFYNRVARKLPKPDRFRIDKTTRRVIEIPAFPASKFS